MPTYRYRAITERGAVVEGFLSADSRDRASEELSRQGLLPSKIHRKLFAFTSAKPSGEALLFFIDELATLIAAGIPIPEALGIIAGEPGRTSFMTTITQVRTEVVNGTRLSDAMALYPSTFDALLRALVRTGEMSGELGASLRHYHRLMERKHLLTQKIIQALVYPSFVLALTAIIIGVLFFFSLPRFIDLYTQLGSDLPGATQVLLALIDWLSNYGWSLPLAILVSLSLIRITVPSEKIAIVSESIIRKLPIVGTLREFYGLSLFCHTLRTLLTSGMPMVDAIKHVAASIPGHRLSQTLRQVAERIQHGGGMVASFRRYELLPPQALKLIDAGERSGTVPEQLEGLAVYYDKIIEQKMSRLVTFLEPMLILFTGLIVGSVVVAMYLPIFGMAGAI